MAVFGFWRNMLLVSKSFWKTFQLCTFTAPQKTDTRCFSHTAMWQRRSCFWKLPFKESTSGFIVLNLIESCEFVLISLKSFWLWCPYLPLISRYTCPFILPRFCQIYWLPCCYVITWICASPLHVTVLICSVNHIIKFVSNSDNLVMYSWILQSKQQTSSEGLFIEFPCSNPFSIRCLVQTDKKLLCLQTQTHRKLIFL